MLHGMQQHLPEALLPQALLPQEPPPLSRRFRLLPRLSGGAVLCLLCCINFFNYVDRMIVAGAPIQFGAFISETLGVPAQKQAFFLGIITPAFMVTFSIASILFGHLVHHVSPFRLLSRGCGVWVFSLFCSGVTYYLPRTPSTFWLFLASRALSGVGEASFQCFVPAYVEDFAPEGSRALWLAVLYAPIPIGSALGLGAGATLAPAPPHSTGWGAAYLLEALIMAPFAVGLAWMPTAKELRRRRRRATTIKRYEAARRALAAATTPNPSSGMLPLLHGSTNTHQESLTQPSTSADVGRYAGDMTASATASAPLPTIPQPRAPSTPEPVAPGRILVPSADDSPCYDPVGMGIAQSPVQQHRSLRQHRGDHRDGSGRGRANDGQASTAPAARHASSPMAAANPPPVPSVFSQIIFLVTSPSYMCIALGYAAFTATVMGISTFAPLCLMALGLFKSQTHASNVFGIVCAVAGILGAPLGGAVTDYAVSFAVPRVRQAGEEGSLHGGSSGEHDVTGSFGDASEDFDSRGQLPTFAYHESVTTQWRRQLREARALVLSITIMILIASMLCVASIAILYGGPSYKVPFLVFVALYVTFSFATSAGINRAVMLIVPSHVRPFALGLLTLFLHALGDVPSPPLVGILIGAWASNCSIVDVNASTGAIVPHGGPGTEPKINPACSGSMGIDPSLADASGYSSGQYGILSVLMLASCYMFTSAIWWGLGVVVLSHRAKVELAQPQPPPGLCGCAPRADPDEPFADGSSPDRTRGSLN